MDDLISRQAAIDALCDEYCDGRQGCKHYPKCENLKAIQNLPSAQLEPTLEQIEEYCHKRCLSIVDNALLHKYAQAEIIRCKDCKYRDEEYRNISAKWLPCMEDIYLDSNWYCGSAERGEQ